MPTETQHVRPPTQPQVSQLRVPVQQQAGQHQPMRMLGQPPLGQLRQRPDRPLQPGGHRLRRLRRVLRHVRRDRRRIRHLTGRPNRPHVQLRPPHRLPQRRTRRRRQWRPDRRHRRPHRRGQQLRCHPPRRRNYGVLVGRVDAVGAQHHMQMHTATGLVLRDPGERQPHYRPQRRHRHAGLRRHRPPQIDRRAPPQLRQPAVPQHHPGEVETVHAQGAAEQRIVGLVTSAARQRPAMPTAAECPDDRRAADPGSAAASPRRVHRTEARRRQRHEQPRMLTDLRWHPLTAPQAGRHQLPGIRPVGRRARRADTRAAVPARHHRPLHLRPGRADQPDRAGAEPGRGRLPPPALEPIAGGPLDQLPLQPPQHRHHAPPTSAGSRSGAAGRRSSSARRLICSSRASSR